VWRVRPQDSQPALLPGRKSARIVFVVEGSLSLAGAGGSLDLGRGEAAFLAAAENDITATGDGVAFVSASGRR
jgi:mannose-6-phosphate isomerase class I